MARGRLESMTKEEFDALSDRDKKAVVADAERRGIIKEENGVMRGVDMRPGRRAAIGDLFKGAAANKVVDKVVNKATDLVGGGDVSEVTEILDPRDIGINPPLSSEIGTPSPWAVGNWGVPEYGGAAVAGYNVMDALGNIGSRRGKGTVEGLGTGAGTAIGAYFGGPIGAGVGSVIGRTAGRGIASVADSLGAFHKGTKEYQKDRTEELRKAGLSDIYIQGREEGGFGSGYVDDPESWQRKEGLMDEKGVLTEAGEKDAASNWGAFGIVKGVGNDYFDKYNERQRYQITQGAIDQGLLKGDMGDIIVTDEDALRGSIEASIANEEYGKKYDEWKKAHPELGVPTTPPTSAQPPSEGGGGGGPVKPKKRRPGAPPSLSDITPEPVPPPIMPEPDDEPGVAEVASVNNYQDMLTKMLNLSKVKKPAYTSM